MAVHVIQIKLPLNCFSGGVVPRSAAPSYVKYKNTLGSIIQLILHRASSQLVALSVGLLAGLTFPTLGIIRVKTFEGLNFQ